MKFVKLCAIYVCLCFVMQKCLQAAEYIDVVYLNNGSVIKGMVIETIPNKSIKIKTADGSLFVYEISEVSKITKEEMQPTGKDIANFDEKPFEENQKSIGKAILFECLFPGVGHYYTMDPVRGGIVTLLAVTPWIFFATLGMPDNGGWVPGVTVSVGSIIYGIVDAPFSAMRFNKKLKKKLQNEGNLSLNFSFQPVLKNEALNSSIMFTYSF